MASSSIIPAGTRAVIFDAYGTLFDVHAAVGRHMVQVGPDAARFSDLWRAKQLEYSWVLSLAGRYEPFWSLTEKALDHALARFPSIDPALRRPLLEAYRRLDPYPEVRETLSALRARGLRTGILSNGDPGMLNDAVTSAGLAGDLDIVLSVDTVQVFKTSPRAYELVLHALSLHASDIVFASSNRWDVAGAAAFGFRAVWVNRFGMPDEYADLPPEAVVADLTVLGA
ncbi:2-haloacid dehalogenase [Microvirga flocculans]|uniref:(S)-2-haloacid dehalogenase n=1 Tax=Microvirga flocculans TaxID=217168 RepID=A0A7W6IH96_9HYPH|nr:haloacid dehalogenase type II [Microvirga flocculans]MBB4041449.1 2-haloacid dehalogenase [Microvirga flocculans]